MDMLLWKTEEKKRTVRIGLWLLIGIAAFYSIVCTAVYHWAQSDILVADSVFPSIWDMVQQIVQIAFYWIAFAFFIFLSAQHTVKGTIAFLWGYAACVCGRYFLSWAVGSLMVMEPFEIGTFLEDILYLFVDIVVDLAQMGIVVLLYFKLVEPHRENGEIKIPLDRKMLDFKDPFLRCLLFSAMIPGVLRIVARIRYDIFFGAAQDFIDLLWMIFYYASDVASIFVGYLVIYLIASHLTLKEKERLLNGKETVSGDSV